MEMIQKQIELLMQAQMILSQIDKIPEEQNSIKVISGQITVLDGEIERYRNLKTRVYTDMLDEIITKEEFADINARFTVKLTDAKRQKEELLRKKHRMMANKTYLKPWVDDLKKYQNITKLEREVVVMLIEEIVVYGKDNIHIRFHYGDEMKEMLGLAGVIPTRAESEEDVKCV